MIPLTVLVAAGTIATGPPYRDPIPQVFWGRYARSAAACTDKAELAYLEVSAERLAYYEADEFLLLGIAFEGSPPDGHETVQMFNGRFTAREEANPLGELNLELALEKPGQLVRYPLKADGEPDTTHPDRWVLCSVPRP